MTGATRRRLESRALVIAVAVAVAAAGVVAGVFPIFESDLFWHLAAGRWIFEQGEIPRFDPFRFTSGGAPWVDHEWLFQIVVRGVEVVAGLDGLIALRAAALGGFALLLVRCARRAGLGVGLAGMLALAAMLGVRPRFLVRPEIVTLFALLTLVLLLDRLVNRRGGPTAAETSRREAKGVLLKGGPPKGSLEVGTAVDDAASDGWQVRLSPRRGGSRGVLVGLVLLVVLWVNFHGQALLAPGVALLFLAGSALEARRESPTARVTTVLFVGIPALLAAALLVNPYGWRLVEVPIGIARALGGLSAHNPEWMSSFDAPQPYLYGGFAVVAVLALAGRLASGRWPAPAWGLPAGAMAVLALSGVRHQALFFALATPYAARCLAAIPDARPGSPRRERGLALVAVCAAGAIALWAAAPPASGPLRPRHGGLAWGAGIAPGRFPERMATVIAANPGIGPLYNEFVHGGYLLWRLFPPRQVFFDGRMELEPGLLGELAASRRDPASWEALLTARGAVGALVRYEDRRLPVFEPDGTGGFRQVGESTANALLFPPERWALVEWDDEAMLFLRPGAPGWSGAPYRFVQPEDLAGTLARAAADPTVRAAMLAELDRKLETDPASRRARWLRDRL
jgi:hypothetical protein